MQQLKTRLSNRAGFTLILMVLLITVFIGAAAFAVDVGHGYLRRADVHAASDAAALAAIAEFQAVDAVNPAAAADSALKEAQAFAKRFKADTTSLTVASADLKLGFCTIPCTPTSNWSSPSPAGSDTNGVMVTVRYTGSYAFGPALGISSHASTATSIAVGVQQSVSNSSCLSPVVISFQQLLAQIGSGLPAGTTLTQADIDSLAKATSGKAVTFDIPNGTQVSGISENEFYQINVPPAETANGTVQNSGPPSSSDFRSAFTCGTGADSYNIGIGDWLEPINGQKANQASKGIGDIGKLPVTIEVAVATTFGNSPKGGCTGCFEVQYLAGFTVTSTAGKNITGYFTALNPPAGSIIATSSAPGPLTEAKLRLVY